MTKLKGKNAYILEVIHGHIRRYIDRKARFKDDGILYYLKVGNGKFRRKFVTLKKAQRIFYDLYGG